MSVLKEKVIKEDGTKEWKPFTLPPGGDTLPIGTIVEIPDDTEIPYGYELVEDENAEVEMKNGYTISPNEKFKLQKHGNLVSLNCIIKAEESIPNDTAEIVMTLPNEYAPKDVFYDVVGLGYSGYNGWTVNTIGTILINKNGNIQIKTNTDDNVIRYAFINLMWVV